jgi:predicted acylesterase/phospholipase RssA
MSSCEPAEDPLTDDVALALSGGGVRALLYGLGALRAVIRARDARPGSRLSVLAAVSGGAIGAAFAAGRVDLSNVTLAEYDAKVMRPAAYRITHRALMFSNWKVFAILAGALGLVGGGISLAILAPLPWPLRVAAALLGVAAAAPVIGQRGNAIEDSMRNSLFEGDMRIGELPRGTKLVLQSTDLVSGEATYLTSDGVSSWRWGDAPAGDLSLVHAARAAATFPIVFGPLRMKSPPFTGGHGDEPPPKTLSLVDGGIYDNMGSEWLIQRCSDKMCRIVVNASQNLKPHDSFYGVPIIGDIITLLRERDIQYDATTAPRRRLHDQLIRNSAGGGTTVLIDGHLIPWLKKFAGKGDRLSERAEKLLAKMSGVPHPDVWERWPKTNAAVATSLGKLRLSTARDLVCAGYLATAVQMHVLENWPEPEAIDPDELMPWLGEKDP